MGACLHQRVDSFGANAQLDTGCTPEIDLALGRHVDVNRL
jgi:hypothetical protein